MLQQGVGVAAATSVVGALIVIVCAAVFSTTTGMASCLAVLPLVLGPIAVRTLGPRARMLIAFATASAGLFVAVMAARELSQPVLHTLERHDDNPMSIVVAALAMVALGTPCLTLSWLLIGRHPRPRLDRFVRVAAPLVLAVAAAITSLSFIARRSRVEASRWRESLPVVAEVAPSAWTRLPDRGDFTIRYRSSTDRGDLHMECRYGRPCEVSFLASGAKAPTGRLHGYALSGQVWGRYRIRSDAKHAILVLEHVWRDSGETEDRSSAAYAPNGESLQPLALGRVRDVIAPPMGWALTAALGIGLATALFMTGMRRRRVEEANGWVEGYVEADGSIVLQDGVRLPARGLDPGTTVVATGVAGVAPTYRAATPGTALTVLVGSVVAGLVP